MTFNHYEYILRSYFCGYKKTWYANPKKAKENRPIIIWNKRWSSSNVHLSCKISPAGGRQNGFSSRPPGRGGPEYDSCSSFMSSELESTSCFDSEDDDATSRSDDVWSLLFTREVNTEHKHSASERGIWIVWHRPTWSQSLVVLVVTPLRSPLSGGRKCCTEETQLFSIFRHLTRFFPVCAADLDPRFTVFRETIFIWKTCLFVC